MKINIKGLLAQWARGDLSLNQVKAQLSKLDQAEADEALELVKELINGAKPAWLNQVSYVGQPLTVDVVEKLYTDWNESDELDPTMDYLASLSAEDQVKFLALITRVEDEPVFVFEVVSAIALTLP